MPNYKRCQSCGMPLKQDPAGGGTNYDGRKSTMFCSYCFENGQFKNLDWTAEEMQKFCQNKLKEQGFGSIAAWLLTRNIPRLQRWQKLAKIADK